MSDAVDEFDLIMSRLGQQASDDGATGTSSGGGGGGGPGGSSSGAFSTSAPLPTIGSDDDDDESGRQLAAAANDDDDGDSDDDDDPLAALRRGSGAPKPATAQKISSSTMTLAQKLATVKSASNHHAAVHQQTSSGATLATAHTTVTVSTASLALPSSSSSGSGATAGGAASSSGADLSSSATRSIQDELLLASRFHSALSPANREERLKRWKKLCKSKNNQQKNFEDLHDTSAMANYAEMFTQAWTLENDSLLLRRARAVVTSEMLFLLEVERDEGRRRHHTNADKEKTELQRNAAGSFESNFAQLPPPRSLLFSPCSQAAQECLQVIEKDRFANPMRWLVLLREIQALPLAKVRHIWQYAIKTFPSITWLVEEYLRLEIANERQLHDQLAEQEQGHHHHHHNPLAGGGSSSSSKKESGEDMLPTMAARIRILDTFEAHLPVCVGSAALHTLFLQYVTEFVGGLDQKTEFDLCINSVNLVGRCYDAFGLWAQVMQLRINLFKEDDVKVTRTLFHKWLVTPMDELSQAETEYKVFEEKLARTTMEKLPPKLFSEHRAAIERFTDRKSLWRVIAERQRNSTKHAKSGAGTGMYGITNALPMLLPLDPASIFHIDRSDQFLLDGGARDEDDDRPHHHHHHHRQNKNKAAGKSNTGAANTNDKGERKRASNNDDNAADEGGPRVPPAPGTTATITTADDEEAPSSPSDETRQQEQQAATISSPSDQPQKEQQQQSQLQTQPQPQQQPQPQPQQQPRQHHHQHQHQHSKNKKRDNKNKDVFGATSAVGSANKHRSECLMGGNRILSNHAAWDTLIELESSASASSSGLASAAGGLKNQHLLGSSQKSLTVQARRVAFLWEQRCRSEPYIASHWLMWARARQQYSKENLKLAQEAFKESDRNKDIEEILSILVEAVSRFPENAVLVNALADALTGYGDIESANSALFQLTQYDVTQAKLLFLYEQEVMTAGQIAATAFSNSNFGTTTGGAAASATTADGAEASPLTPQQQAHQLQIKQHAMATARRIASIFQLLRSRNSQQICEVKTQRHDQKKGNKKKINNNNDDGGGDNDEDESSDKDADADAALEEQNQNIQETQLGINDPIRLTTYVVPLVWRFCDRPRLGDWVLATLGANAYEPGPELFTKNQTSKMLGGGGAGGAGQNKDNLAATAENQRATAAGSLPSSAIVFKSQSQLISKFVELRSHVKDNIASACVTWMRWLLRSKNSRFWTSAITGGLIDVAEDDDATGDDVSNRRKKKADFSVDTAQYHMRSVAKYAVTNCGIGRHPLFLHAWIQLEASCGSQQSAADAVSSIVASWETNTERAITLAGAQLRKILAEKQQQQQQQHQSSSMYSRGGGFSLHRGFVQVAEALSAVRAAAQKAKASNASSSHSNNSSSSSSSASLFLAECGGDALFFQSVRTLDILNSACAAATAAASKDQPLPPSVASGKNKCSFRENLAMKKFSTLMYSQLVVPCLEFLMQQQQQKTSADAVSSSSDNSSSSDAKAIEVIQSALEAFCEASSSSSSSTSENQQQSLSMLFGTQQSSASFFGSPPCDSSSSANRSFLFTPLHIVGLHCPALYEIASEIRELVENSRVLLQIPSGAIHSSSLIERLRSVASAAQSAVATRSSTFGGSGAAGQMMAAHQQSNTTPFDALEQYDDYICFEEATRRDIAARHDLAERTTAFCAIDVPDNLKQLIPRRQQQQSQQNAMFNKLVLSNPNVPLQQLQMQHQLMIAQQAQQQQASASATMRPDFSFFTKVLTGREAIVARNEAMKAAAAANRAANASAAAAARAAGGGGQNRMNRGGGGNFNRPGQFQQRNYQQQWNRAQGGGGGRGGMGGRGGAFNYRGGGGGGGGGRGGGGGGGGGRPMNMMMSPRSGSGGPGGARPNWNNNNNQFFKQFQNRGGHGGGGRGGHGGYGGRGGGGGGGRGGGGGGGIAKAHGLGFGAHLDRRRQRGGDHQRPDFFSNVHHRGAADLYASQVIERHHNTIVWSWEALAATQKGAKGAAIRIPGSAPPRPGGKPEKKLDPEQEALAMKMLSDSICPHVARTSASRSTGKTDADADAVLADLALWNERLTDEEREELQLVVDVNDDGEIGSIVYWDTVAQRFTGSALSRLLHRLPTLHGLAYDPTADDDESDEEGVVLPIEEFVDQDDAEAAQKRKKEHDERAEERELRRQNQQQRNPDAAEDMVRKSDNAQYPATRFLLRTMMES